MKYLDEQYFNSCDFSAPEKVEVLSDIYEIRYYTVTEEVPEGSYIAPFFGAEVKADSKKVIL